jgi:hypothetical protein
VVKLDFIPFAPEHLPMLRLQAAQAYLQPLMAKPEYGASLAGPYAWSGLLGHAVIGCAGILPQWPGRAIAWALLTRGLTARHFLHAHHKVAAVLRAAHAPVSEGGGGLRRIETSVDAGFDAGHRWARALGFEPEGLMRAYSPDGRDHVLYARVQEAAPLLARNGATHPARGFASPVRCAAAQRRRAQGLAHREEGAPA